MPPRVVHRTDKPKAGARGKPPPGKGKPAEPAPPQPPYAKLHRIRAFGVPDVDQTAGSNSSDPYVVFEALDGDEVFSSVKTRYVLNNANPVWDDVLYLPLPTDSKEPPRVRVTMWDKDFNASDDVIATIETTLNARRGPVKTTLGSVDGSKAGVSIDFSYAVVTPAPVEDAPDVRHLAGVG